MKLLGRADIEGLLAAHGLRASRALGQNFLADPNTARRIARMAGVGPGDRVLEIGPGVGSLTLALAETGASVLALERDRHVLPALAGVLSGLENVEVVEGDAMEADFPTLLGSRGPGWVMVSNLPYNIATPLLADMVEDVPQVERYLVMVQREVARRITAPPGTRAAGAVSVKIALYAEAEMAGAVPASVFVPRPKVESALVAIRRRSSPAVEVPSPARLIELARAGFGHRRKTLRRALAPALADAGALLEAAGIDPKRRAEELSLEDWAALARAEAETAPPRPGES